MCCVFRMLTISPVGGGYIRPVLRLTHNHGQSTDDQQAVDFLMENLCGDILEKPVELCITGGSRWRCW